MAITKKDLEEMMSKQKEERMAEMTLLKEILMDSVKNEIEKQVTAVREEIKDNISEVKVEVDDQIKDVKEKQNEMSDVQSVLDCRVDKLEEELRSLKQDQKIEEPGNHNKAQSDTKIKELVEYATRVIGFKPIEHKDICRMKRTLDIQDDEEAKRECLREFWRCEMRIPKKTVEELLDQVVKVWEPSEEDEHWDKLFVEFEDQKTVKICYSYCKFMRNKDSQIQQYFPLQFRDQYRTLDTIAYKLRNPEDPRAEKLKTRIRYGQLGLELEQKHPEQRNWNKVLVNNLPPVDLSPVPPPTASSSPPSSRSRQDKRPRSPNQSPDISPAARNDDKRTKVEKKVKKTINVETDLTFNSLDIEKEFSFNVMKNRFAK